MRSGANYFSGDDRKSVEVTVNKLLQTDDADFIWGHNKGGTDQDYKIGKQRSKDECLYWDSAKQEKGGIVILSDTTKNALSVDFDEITSTNK